MADAPLPAVRPPELVYRVARGLDAFAPPDWAYALPDGTFGNRFDDPSADKGVPEEERYRAFYCATERAGAFGETIARFRPSVKLLAGLEEVEDDEPLDPELQGGVVPEEWRLSRRAGSTRLVPDLLFADDRSTLEEAQPGDIVGLVNSGELSVGDTVYEYDQVRFPPLPEFEPEHFLLARNKNSAKHKQFHRGLRQLSDEGVGRSSTARRPAGRSRSWAPSDPCSSRLPSTAWSTSSARRSP